MGPATLLPLLGLTLYLHRRFSLDPAIGLLFAISMVVLLLFIGALSATLLVTAIALYLVGSLLLATESIRLARTGAVRPPPVPVTFLAILGTAYWFRYGDTTLFFYDEYTQWGRSLKELLSNDRLWDSQTNVLYPRLVPGAALFQYWFARFSRLPDGAAYLAQFTLFAAPLMVLLSGIRWRQVGWIAGVIALGLLALVHLGPGVSTLYLDHLVGAWFAGSLLAYVLVRQHETAVWWLVPATSLAVLALTKRTGLAFAVAAGLIIAGMELARGCRNRAKWSRNLAGAVAALAMTIAPALLCTLSWELNRDRAGAVDDRSSIASNVMAFERLSQAFSSDRGREVTQHFSEALRHVRLGNNDWFWQLNEFNYPVIDLYTSGRGLTAVGVLIIFSAWWAGVLAFRRSLGMPPEWWILAMGCLLTAITYTALTYGHYLVALNAGIPSYTRYMNTMVLAMLLVSMAPLLPGFQMNEARAEPVENRCKSCRAALLVAGLAALYWHESPEVSRVMLPNPPIEARRQWEPLASELRRAIGDHSIWVYLPDEDPRAFSAAVLTYLLSPKRATVTSSPPLSQYDAKQMLDAVSSFDYLLIFEPATSQANDHPELTALGVQPNRLMRITRDEHGEIVIRPVDN